MHLKINSMVIKGLFTVVGVMFTSLTYIHKYYVTNYDENYVICGPRCKNAANCDDIRLKHVKTPFKV